MATRSLVFFSLFSAVFLATAPTRLTAQTKAPDAAKDEKDKTHPYRAKLLPPYAVDPNLLPIDLTTALRLANASNPTIAMARARLQQALYRRDQAELMWIPNAQAGLNYLRHDGLIQNSRGDVFPVSRWSFFYGGGAALRLETADALFSPLVARQLTDAQAAETRAVTDQLQLKVVNAYLDLVEVYGRLAIAQETLANAQEMAKNAEAAQKAGTGKTPADAQRAQTEVQARVVERNELEGRAGEMSARLAQLLLLPPTVDLRPADTGVLPLELVSLDGRLDELVQIGLGNRPEIARARSLIGAAQSNWRRAQFSPLLPRLEVYYAAGSFSGGRNDFTIDTGGRGDGGVQALWELQNFGLGNIAKTRERRAAIDEANYYLMEVEAQVGAEISSAAKLALARKRNFEQAQEGVRQALEMWRRLREFSFGLGGKDRRFDPMEPLIAEQQLNVARLYLLSAVIGYNRAQFLLYTSLGQPPECSLPHMTAIPLETSPLPDPRMGPTK